MRPPTDQRSYWNRVARQKSFGHPLDRVLLARHVPRAGAILDLGCGYGRAVRDLVDLGWRRAVGVDTAADMVLRGRESNPDLDLRIIEPGPLPFEGASFDAVLLFSVLTCVPDEVSARELVTEIHRVLRPGGVLYVSDLPIQSDERNRARYVESESRYGLAGVFEHPDGITFRHWAREGIDDLTAGFERLEWRQVAVRTMNGHPARAFQLLARRPLLQ